MSTFPIFLQQHHSQPLFLQLQQGFPRSIQQAVVPHPRPEPPAVQMSESDQFWLKRFEAYLQEHHASPTLSVPELAEAFALSESSLLRQVKRLVGFTPVHYLRQIRLQQAWHLLRSGTYPSVQQVAFAVGYRNTRSFTRSFKEQYGQPPSNFLLR